jgi:DNA-binding transcriptional ArsR family regulator
MQGQTELILEALGQSDLAAMLAVLARKTATEAELTRELDLGQSVATRGLKQLRTVGLVARDAQRGPYRSSFPDETRLVLEAVSRLSDRIVGARAERDAWLRAQLTEQDR